MELTPSFDEFVRGYEAGENQVVYARLAADLDTPVSAWYKVCAGQPYSFLLESIRLCR